MNFNHEPRVSQKKKMKTAELEKRILSSGLKITRLRRIILEILIQADDHLNVAQIHSLACQGDDFFALASVYRNMNLMLSIGMLTAHQFKSGQAYYELADTNPHDHLIDLTSGQIIEFRNAALDQLKAKIAKQYGYRSEDCHVEFYARPM